jgi:hypothetical protein
MTIREPIFMEVSQAGFRQTVQEVLMLVGEVERRLCKGEGEYDGCEKDDRRRLDATPQAATGRLRRCSLINTIHSQ